MTEGNAGRLTPCCVSLRWAVSCGYIRKGYVHYGYNPPLWCGWTLKVAGPGYYDVSPVSFCPFCGVDLDAPDN